LLGKIGQAFMSLAIRDKMYGLMSEGLHNVTITNVEDLGLEATQFGTKECAAIYFAADDQKLTLNQQIHGPTLICRNE